MRKSIMWQYIEEIPQKARYLMDHSQIDQLVDQLDLHSIKRMVFVGSGSSNNVSLIAKKLFEDYAKIATEVYIPSEFTSKSVGIYHPEETLVIGISQTGTSAGTLAAIQHAKAGGLSVLSMTEGENTPLQEEGTYYLNFLCGEENSNAKTKGYVNSLLLLQLLALKIAKKKRLLSEEEYQQLIYELRSSIEEIPQTIMKTKKWAEEHTNWSEIQQFLVLGYGMNYGSAVEGMLKLVETTGHLGSVCELSEFSHGFHRAVTPDTPVLLIQSNEEGEEEAQAAIMYLKEKVKDLLVINSTEKQTEEGSFINLTPRKSIAVPLNNAIVFQVLSVALPEMAGKDPNRDLNNDYTDIVRTRV